MTSKEAEILNSERANPAIKFLNFGIHICQELTFNTKNFSVKHSICVMHQYISLQSFYDNQFMYFLKGKSDLKTDVKCFPVICQLFMVCVVSKYFLQINLYATMHYVH